MRPRARPKPHTSQAGFTQFVDQCSLDSSDSKHCNRGHLDTMFIAVDVARQAALKGSCEVAKAEAQKDIYNEKNSLNRQEFIRLLVMIATNKYVLDGKIPLVATAVRRGSRGTSAPRATHPSCPPRRSTLSTAAPPQSVEHPSTIC